MAVDRFIRLDSVGSTNDHAKDLARQGAAEGAIITARHQTGGRGRHGNSWTSIDGNLYMSIILRPDLPVMAAGQLSFLAAVALAEVMRDFAIPVQLKWPNDLLIEGKKAAGILLESESAPGGKNVDWVVIGIGVNVAGAPDGAASLASLGVTKTAEQILEMLAEKIKLLYDMFKHQGFGPIREKWLGYAYNIGNIIRIRLPQETFEATFVGIDADGALEVETGQGLRRIASGEVFA